MVTVDESSPNFHSCTTSSKKNRDKIALLAYTDHDVIITTHFFTHITERCTNCTIAQ